MRSLFAPALFLTALLLSNPLAAATPIDLTKYNASCGIAIETKDNALTATWKTEAGKFRLNLNLAPDTALISSLEFAPKDAPVFNAIIENANVEFPITIGSRKPAANKLEGYVFFDKPAGRKFETVSTKLDKQSLRVESSGKRVSILISKLSAGAFNGELVIRLFADSPLIQIQAALTPTGNQIAYIYDALLSGGINKIAWEDFNGKIQTRTLDGDKLTPIAVKYRTLIGQSKNGSIAVFPAPHAFFFPRDRTDNFSFAQYDKSRFGLRQDPVGGGAFVPWIDAPDGKTQVMDFFLFPTPSLAASEIIEQVKRYTHNDTYEPLEGYKTFTSHFHSRLTVGQLAGKSPVREFAYVFQKMGVDIVHLAEFHGDGHPGDGGPERLKELQTMFDLCNTFSDAKILLLPGEEGNKYLAHPWPAENKIHPGHWMCLFPRHVYFTWVRAAGQPFSEDIAPFGKVYHVGDRDDMIRLLKEERGLAWTSHPRIKASFATPDAFKDQDFYKGPLWLGGAWKAMPANLADDRLGVRCLDLLDDMSNWAVVGGYPLKALPGEVDVFELDRNHELYGHMNINYLKLEKSPPVNDCTAVLQALSKREFFTTTGEVLIHSFEAKGGIIRTDLQWTFPPAFAEIITGDGKSIKRQRIDLSAHGEFGRGPFEWKMTDTAAKWVRLEVWDVARNGAYSQSVEAK